MFSNIVLVFTFSIILLFTPFLVYADRHPTEPPADQSPPNLRPDRSDTYSEQANWELLNGLLSVYMSNNTPLVGEYINISCEFRSQTQSGSVTPLLIITNKDSGRELFRGDYGVDLRSNTTQEIRITCAVLMVDDSTNYEIHATYVFSAKESDDSDSYFDDGNFITILPPDDDNLTSDESTSSKGGCNDCTPPTLGYNSMGVKKVDNGVCINDSCMDGGKYHTEYPMQNTLLYFPNTILLKYYENGSPSNIQMAQLGLGVYEVGSPLSESQAVIEVWLNPFKNDIYNPSIKEIIVTDTDEILSWYDATIQLVPCMDDNTSNNNCLEFNFKFAYAKPPQSPILVSQAWDIPRNTINNYFNDGLNVIYSSESIIPTITTIPEETQEECDYKSVSNRNNPCQFLPLVNAEIQRAQDYLNQLK